MRKARASAQKSHSSSAVPAVMTAMYAVRWTRTAFSRRVHFGQSRAVLMQQYENSHVPRATFATRASSTGSMSAVLHRLARVGIRPQVLEVALLVVQVGVDALDERRVRT